MCTMYDYTYTNQQTKANQSSHCGTVRAESCYLWGVSQNWKHDIFHSKWIDSTATRLELRYPSIYGCNVCVCTLTSANRILGERTHSVVYSMLCLTSVFVDLIGMEWIICSFVFFYYFFFILATMTHCLFCKSVNGFGWSLVLLTEFKGSIQLGRHWRNNNDVCMTKQKKHLEISIKEKKMFVCYLSVVVLEATVFSNCQFN